MKKIFGLLVLVGAMYSCEQNTSVDVRFKTTMKVNAVYDAKQVAVGEVIKAKFLVENTGDAPLVLSDVKGSCSCTVTEYPKDPIQPGESKEIIAKVETKNASPGELNKSVTIMANTTPPSTTVKVHARIIR